MKIKHTRKITSSIDTGMNYWYLSRHGIGPGTIPSGVKIIKCIDDGWDTYMLLDRLLTTEELKFYDLKEKAPSDDLLLDEVNGSSTTFDGGNYILSSDDWEDEEDWGYEEDWEDDDMPSWDWSRDNVVPEIESSLKVNEEIANLIYDWYSNEEAWEDFDSVKDFVFFLKDDIYDMADACDSEADRKKVLEAIQSDSNIDKVFEDDTSVEYIVSVSRVSPELDLSLLEDDIRAGIRQYFLSPEGGWPEDEVDDALDDYTVVDIHRNDDDNATVVEVRAELSYDGMVELSEILDDIIARYDENAYFEMVTSGIMEAYLFDNASIESSDQVNQCEAVLGSYLDDSRALQQWENSRLEPPEPDYEEMDTVHTDFDFEFVIATDGDDWEIVSGDPIYNETEMVDTYLSPEQVLEDFDRLIDGLIEYDEQGTYKVTGTAHMTYEYNYSDDEYKLDYPSSKISDLNIELISNSLYNDFVTSSNSVDIAPDFIKAEEVDVKDTIAIEDDDSELTKGTVVTVLGINDPGEDWIDYTFRVKIISEPDKGRIADIHFDSGEVVGTLVV